MTEDPLQHPDRVVVGVDWTRRSVSVLRWAATEVLAHGGCLVAVHACGADGHPAPYAPVAEPPDGDRAVRDDCAHLTAVLAEAFADMPGTPVRSVCDLRPAVRALLAHGTGASMLVLAASPRDAGGGVTLGSTALACVRNAPCPVVILPVAH